MASVLKVDEVKGVASAGSITVTGEGGTTTQSLQQGLSKHWIFFDEVAVAVNDSFNNSSITDQATGRFFIDMTTAFGNVNYAIQSSANTNNGDTWEVNQSVNAKQNWLQSETNTTLRYDTASYANGNYVDSKYYYCLGNGDLA